MPPEKDQRSPRPLRRHRGDVSLGRIPMVTDPTDLPRSRPAPGIALLLAISLGMLFFPRIAPPDGRWWGAAWDGLHVPGFFLITWGIDRLLSLVVRRRGRRVALAVAAAVAIAAGSEWSHQYLGRSSEWEDLVRDGIGIGFAVIALLGWSRWGKRGRAVYVAAAVACLLLLFLPAWRTGHAVKRQASIFPDLGGFGSRASLVVWRPQGNTEVSLDREAKTLTVRTGPGRHGGVHLRTVTRDWRDFEALHLELENPGEAFHLGLRIDDVLTDSVPGRTRYDGERLVPPGRVAISLPLGEVASGPRGRTLDLGRIHRLVLFTGDEAVERVFVINSAFLR